MSSNAPIIRIEVERMTQCIRAMLDDHVFSADAAIKAALDDFAKRSDQFIAQEASREIEKIVGEEVANFFRYGHGRAAIRAAVEVLLEGRGGVA